MDRLDTADVANQTAAQRCIRIASVIVAVISLVVAVVAVWGIPDYMIDDGGGYDVIDGVKVSRALGVSTPEELAERSGQPYTMIVYDTANPCVSYNCWASLSPVSVDEAFENKDTACHPYLQWVCATDDYHRVVTRTAW